ncbi:creatininase family protein [Parvularcula sp. ZS-1/3]|uniref:Creatininase family protein n=1 Tax=Parvularcula mediterranea TaxID=2732508 RepID=A0A7Y3W551_9PROT|nr:creatininase family protein [Parvularcula mediterranea]NNU16148.1 creatininase family protein [Parvularcula mediterranea]
MRPIRHLTTSLALALIAGSACAQQAQDGDREARLKAALEAPRPIEAVSSPWIEDLTWMEVRDAIADGATTAIIPTGGIEQNGPYLTTGKHNVILEGVCPALVQELGDALCAPIVGFVPEGSIEPPSGMMHFPGTISVREETFVALISDIASSLRQHGFETIVLLGDSGGNQSGLKTAADTLNAQWEEGTGRALYLEAFYEPGWTDTEKYTAEVLGVSEGEREGLHDDIWVTAMMMATDPETVRHAQRLEKGLASINGVDISDKEATAELGRKMIAFRASHAAKAIRAALAEE